jgi:hypothetical protein
MNGRFLCAVGGKEEDGGQSIILRYKGVVWDLLMSGSMLAVVRNSVRRRSSLTHAYLVHYSRPRSSRRFSTSSLDPSIRDFARTLIQKQPCVAMSADDVNILAEPREFHQLLLVGVFDLSVL